MKNKASDFIKEMVSTLVSLVKAKSIAVKNKTNTMKTRLMILRVLRNKKALFRSISQKIHALTGHHNANALITLINDDGEEDPPPPMNVIVTNKTNEQEFAAGVEEDKDDHDDGYPDLRHTMFNEDEDDCNGSVIDLVKNNRQNGSEFKLEDEIDQVADVFIRRFHKRMWLQQQRSFKLYQEMLARGV